MQKPEVFALQRSGLNEFLFAPVGIEANGMTLSLLSVFARAGSDPWREAGRLDRLPTAEAIASLARTIAAMPKSLWAMSDATTIATGLIALLPGRSARAEQSVVSAPPSWNLPRLIWIAVVLAGFALGTVHMLGLFATPQATVFDADRDASAITSAPTGAVTHRAPH